MIIIFSIPSAAFMVFPLLLPLLGSVRVVTHHYGPRKGCSYGGCVAGTATSSHDFVKDAVHILGEVKQLYFKCYEPLVLRVWLVRGANIVHPSTSRPSV